MRTLFVVGSGRSGTSLMRRILVSDPEVSIVSESHFLDYWLPKYPDPVELWEHFRQSRRYRSLGVEVDPSLESPRALFESLLDAKAAGARVRGDKTPAHFRYIGRLLKWFPDAQVVFVVREPRAVIGSFMAQPETWASGSLIEHIRLWNSSAAQAVRWRDHGSVHLVRYEDLTADPLGVLSGLWPAAVGHPFDPALLPSGDAKRHPSGSLRGGSIRSDRREIWRERLTPRQQKLVLRGCASLMDQLAYPTDGPRASSLALRSATLVEDGRRAARALGHPGAFLRRLDYRRRQPGTLPNYT
jgi:hypothetical protein